MAKPKEKNYWCWRCLGVITIEVGKTCNCPVCDATLVPPYKVEDFGLEALAKELVFHRCF